MFQKAGRMKNVQVQTKKATKIRGTGVKLQGAVGISPRVRRRHGSAAKPMYLWGRNADRGPALHKTVTAL